MTWFKLGHGIREQFKKELAERPVKPRIQPDMLRGMPDCYKIKLRCAGYRLVYQVLDSTARILRVVSVGKPGKGRVYDQDGPVPPNHSVRSAMTPL